MRQPVKIIVAAVLAAGIATGCGSDDDATKGDSGGSDEPNASKQADKPKPPSARSEMVNCMEDAGFEVTHEDQDAATATRYTVEGDDAGSKKAEIVIHSNREGASRSAVKAAQEEGTNAVAFGRAEFIPHDAENRELGVLANCIAEGYVH